MFPHMSHGAMKVFYDRMYHRIHPSTALFVAFSSWIVVLGVNLWWVSVCVIVVSWILTPQRSVATILLTLPMALSFFLIHLPFGELWLATTLSLRCCALIASLLAAACFLSVSRVSKAVQMFSPRMAYIVGASMNLLPTARRITHSVRTAFILSGRPPRTYAMIIPIITHLLMEGTARGIPLESAGVSLPGKRTLLVPLADSFLQRVVRYCAPIAAVVVTVCVVSFSS